MGYIVRPGDFVQSRSHKYRVLKEINKGGFADAFKAVDEHGDSVFFKQYKSPSILVPWFDDYFKYENELNRRLREDPVLSTASVYATETFLGIPKSGTGRAYTKNKCLFQAFPFIEGNLNLADVIEKSPEKFDWEKRVYASSVFAFALRRLHDVNVVHCDLKPENVQIKLDPSIAIKYRPLLVDMDWSILSDKKAPWHGKQGYVGTAGYNSPEHLRGEAPLEASDVFTAAVILCQVLACVHPFGSRLGEDDFNDYVLSGRCDFKTAADLPFKGDVPASLAGLLFSALDVNPKNRPTMAQIHDELMSLCKSIGKPKYVPGPAPVPVVEKPEASAEKAPVAKKTRSVKKTGPVGPITIKGDLGSFSTSMTFVMDQTMLRNVSSQAGFADSSNQFKLEKSGTGWTLTPNPSAVNLTVVNGGEVMYGKILESGDVINLKGRSSGKLAMSLEVKIT